MIAKSQHLQPIHCWLWAALEKRNRGVLYIRRKTGTYFLAKAILSHCLLAAARALGEQGEPVEQVYVKI